LRQQNLARPSKHSPGGRRRFQIDPKGSISTLLGECIESSEKERKQKLDNHLGAKIRKPFILTSDHVINVMEKSCNVALSLHVLSGKQMDA
jgi:hypothetical protein